MDTIMIKTEIRQILETLNEQWEMVQQHEGRIPQIELDLIRANIRDLYEAFFDLSKKNDAPPGPLPTSPVEHEEPQYHEVILTPPTPTPAPPEYAAPQYQEIFSPPPPPPSTPPVIQPSPAPQPVQPAESPEISFRPPKPEVDLFSTVGSGTTISDKLKEEKVTLNEKLQQDNSASTLSTRLHENPIKDLKSSIGINEKFLFINELFNGSMQDYSQAIIELNQFNNYEEALQFIDILKFKYNWDTNSDAYHKIMDFIRRRYL